MGEPKFPVVFAVGLWAASALAVWSFTYIAFKETATDVESLLQIGATPLVASEAIITAESTGVTKPLERNHFKKSGGR